MSNPDKHTPLSPEELFKLLDSQSNKASDFDELDDFEKEALDGFTSHSSAHKAKALTDELNLAISKKVIASQKGASKNKLIWFSVAASIALVITMSVFFFNQSKDDSKTNLALNEAQDNIPKPKQLETEKPLETISDYNANSPQQKEPEFKAPLKSQETLLSRSAATRSLATVGASTAFTESENKPEFANNSIAKDESKNRTEGDSDGLLDMVDGDSKTKTQPSLAAGSAAGKEKSKLSEEQVNNEMQANQSIATNLNSTNTNTTKREDGYYNADKSVAQEESKKKAEKSTNLSKESSDMDKAKSDVDKSVYSAPASISSDLLQQLAYYPGGVPAIKAYVLNNLKSKTTKEIIGTYKITAIVFENGTLKVNTITQMSKDNCNCSDSIMQTLNTMTKWIPKLVAGFPENSEIEFTLVF